MQRLRNKFKPLSDRLAAFFSRSSSIRRLHKSSSRGQTVLETLFVFGSILFLTFAMMNLSVAMHTKFVATYAAFMAGRSYQVYGDQTGADLFEEHDSSGGKLLSDLPTLSVVRTAEDIMTCALPWLSVPKGDELPGGGRPIGVGKRCLEGQRKYESTNIDRQIAFLRFDGEENSFGASEDRLEKVDDAYHEEGRPPLRYAIMRLRYKSPIFTNLFNLFDGVATVAAEGGGLEERFVDEAYRRRVWHRVYVPVLLNPGLSAGVQDAPAGQDPNSPLDEEGPPIEEDNE